MLQIIANLFLMIFQNYVIIKFLILLQNKNKLQLKELALLVVLIIESYKINVNISYPLFSTFIPIITLILFFWIFYHEKFNRILFNVLLSFFTMYFINLIILCILYFLTIDYFELLPLEKFVISLIVISLYMILLMIVSFIKRVGNNINSILWFKLALIPCISIIIIEILYYYISYTLKYHLLLIFLILLILIINFIMLQLLLELSQSLVENKNNEILKISNDFEKIILKDLKDTYNNNLQLQHDFNNHLLVIKRSLNNKAIKSYIQELEEHFSQVNFINSDNVVLNYIINSKLMNYNGKFKFACFGDLSTISDYDIVTIFGNLIDNALEAQKNINNKFISISINELDDKIIISLKNTYSHKLKIENNIILTTKNDKKSHGFGLKNIENVIKKYNGDLHIEYDEKLFTINCKLIK